MSGYNFVLGVRRTLLVATHEFQLQVKHFMTYCDTMTSGLDRVLFVHSTGHEAGRGYERNSRRKLAGDVRSSRALEALNPQP